MSEVDKTGQTCAQSATHVLRNCSSEVLTEHGHMHNRLLTTPIVARQLQLSHRRVRGMIRAGELPAIPVGRDDFRVDPRDIDNWIRRNKTDGTAQQ